MFNIEQLTRQYWFYEMEIAKIADIFGITRTQLIERIGEFPVDTRRYVHHALNCQKEILLQGNKILTGDIKRNKIVQLDEYRKLKV